MLTGWSAVEWSEGRKYSTDSRRWRKRKGGGGRGEVKENEVKEKR